MTEQIPTVVFDIRLGKYVDFIDFDYQEFSSMANEADLSSEQVEAYTIHFSATDAVVGTGRYIQRRKTANIFVPTIIGSGQDSAELINDTVIHETGHYIDHENHNGDRNARNFRLKKYAVISAFATGVGSSVLESNPLFGFAGAAFVVGTVLVGERRYPMPNMRPTERFAYSYEYKNHDKKLVTIAPKVNK